MIPVIPESVLANAKQVWKESIAKFGREITLSNADESLTIGPIRAFTKRPKILGLFDRTEQSYDQERYMVMVDADDFPTDVTPEKFMRARWDDEDHSFISVTQVDLLGTVFGWRILVKG